MRTLVCNGWSFKLLATRSTLLEFLGRIGKMSKCGTKKIRKLLQTTDLLMFSCTITRSIWVLNRSRYKDLSDSWHSQCSAPKGGTQCCSSVWLWRCGSGTSHSRQRPAKNSSRQAAISGKLLGVTDSPWVGACLCQQVRTLMSHLRDLMSRSSGRTESRHQ